MDKPHNLTASLHDHAPDRIDHYQKAHPRTTYYYSHGQKYRTKFWLQFYPTYSKTLRNLWCFSNIYRSLLSHVQRQHQPPTAPLCSIHWSVLTLILSLLSSHVEYRNTNMSECLQHKITFISWIPQVSKGNMECHASPPFEKSEISCVSIVTSCFKFSLQLIKWPLLYQSLHPFTPSTIHN